jgi:hypothetical protein
MFVRIERFRQSLVLLAARSLVRHVSVLSRARQVLRVTMLASTSLRCFQSPFPTTKAARAVSEGSYSLGTYLIHTHYTNASKRHQRNNNWKGMHALSEKIACALPLTRRAFSWARIVPSHSFSSRYLDNGKTPPRTQALVPDR